MNSYISHCVSGLGEEELVASQEVIDEIFTEAEKVVIYRAHFELQRAKNARQNDGSTSGKNYDMKAQI